MKHITRHNQRHWNCWKDPPPPHTLAHPSLSDSVKEGDGLWLLTWTTVGMQVPCVCACLGSPSPASPGRLSVCHLSRQPFRLCCHCYGSMLRQMAAKISKQSLLNTHATKVLVGGELDSGLRVYSLVLCDSVKYSVDWSFTIQNVASVV